MADKKLRMKRPNEKELNNNKKSNVLKHHSDFVLVNRDKEIQKQRSLLPIILEEDRIMESISDNTCVIICGTTGCGKTTQVPQFLYEGGYSNKELSNFKKGMIGVTQPRRIAAIAMASRVAHELCAPNQVSYQIRFESTVTEETRIKFMTDGILLKEIEQDFTLSQYSVIVIDEAHERSLHTDILIGLLSRIVPLRKKRGNPLKWFIMSATLCVEEFLKNKLLFSIPPPLIEVNSRQFSVTVHHCKTTPSDYLNAAFKRVCRIHRGPSSGHILIFVPSQREIKQLCHQITEKFVSHNGSLPLNKHNRRANTFGLKNESSSSDDEIKNDDETDDESSYIDCDINPIVVYPLFALLPKEQQNKIFEKVEPGIRKCIVSTNVAETSLTIPGIKYIIDTGKVKNKVYDKITGAEKYETTWCSKASAEQRRGRAGRTGSGHCYRLYSTAVFQHELPDFAVPDILKQSIQSVVLQMKCMNLDRIDKFPFPTVPNPIDVKKAEETLLTLGAIESARTSTGINTRATKLGRQINCIPLLPRYSKMIIESISHGCAPYVIIIAAALSVRELFIDDLSPRPTDKDSKNHCKVRSQLWGGKGIKRKLGDYMVMLNCIGACHKSDDLISFCYQYGIRYKAIEEVRKLYQHINNQILKMFNLKIDDISTLSQPSDDEAETIRKILTVCFKDQIARKIPKTSINYDKKFTLYQCKNIDSPLRIHQNSSCRNRHLEVILFNELLEGNHLSMKSICEVEEDWAYS